MAAGGRRALRARHGRRAADRRLRRRARGRLRRRGRPHGARIDDAVRQDIGGAKQRITEVRTAYENTRFTLVLLPAWLATYRHGGQSFSLLVNGSSAEVAGEHPVSRGKVVATVAVLLVAAVVGGILMWGH
ncbi:hypothetical protein ACFQ9X_18435 [Catenulispora yoronensis]